MPRYHFHLKRGAERIDDAIGVDLPDDAAAHAVAREVVAEQLARHEGGVGDLDGWQLEIADGTGRPVATIPLRLEEC